MCGTILTMIFLLQYLKYLYQKKSTSDSPRQGIIDTNPILVQQFSINIYNVPRKALTYIKFNYDLSEYRIAFSRNEDN